MKNHPYSAQGRRGDPPASNNNDNVPLLVLLLGGFVGIFVVVPLLYFGRHIIYHAILDCHQVVVILKLFASTSAAAASSMSVAATVVLTIAAIVVVPYALSWVVSKEESKGEKKHIFDDEKEDNSNLDDDHVEKEQEQMPLQVRIQTDDDDDEFPLLLSTSLRLDIALHVLPPALRDYTWQRLYSTARDGDAFVTFTNRVQGERRTLVVVKAVAASNTAHDHPVLLVGAYSDVEWQTSGSPVFVCGVNMRLFRCPFLPNDNDDDADGNDDDAQSNMQVYKWTQKNRFGALCDRSKQRIAFGGGGEASQFGLCIDSNFTRGTSATCPTFDNPPLVTGDKDIKKDDDVFEILDMEVYGFRLMG